MVASPRKGIAIQKVKHGREQALNVVTGLVGVFNASPDANVEVARNSGDVEEVERRMIGSPNEAGQLFILLSTEATVNEIRLALKLSAKTLV